MASTLYILLERIARDAGCYISVNGIRAGTLKAGVFLPTLLQLPSGPHPLRYPQLPTHLAPDTLISVISSVLAKHDFPIPGETYASLLIALTDSTQAVYLNGYPVAPSVNPCSQPDLSAVLTYFKEIILPELACPSVPAPAVPDPSRALRIAQAISDYLMTGMHHSTPEGLARMSQLIIPNS